MRHAYHLVILAIIAAAVSAAAEEKLNLKLNLAPTSSYFCTMDMSQTITQTIDGENQTLTQGMLMVWEYTVVGKSKSGETDVSLTYRRIKVTQDYGHQVTEYDSDNPPTFLDPSMKGLASLPGTKLSVKLTPEGKVAKISGVEALLDKMIKAMQLPESPEKAAVIENLRKQFGTEAMKQSLEQITGFYSQKPVAIGDTWANELEMTSGFPMTISSKYTLKSRQSGIASIDISSEIMSDSTNPVTMGSLAMAYDVKGGQSGAIDVEEATGLPVNSQIKMNFAGTVQVSGVPDQAPQTWPISATGSVSVSFKKK